MDFRVDFRGLKNLSREKKSCFYGGLKNLFKKTFMCKISLEYNLKTKFSLKQVALQVELGEFRGNFGGVRKMFLKYLSVRCARKDTTLPHWPRGEVQKMKVGVFWWTSPGAPKKN